MFKRFKEEQIQINAIINALTDILIDYKADKYPKKPEVGLRVRINYDNGKTQDGRVLKYNQDKKLWMINRDGYAGTIGIPEKDLNLLFPGFEALVDKKLWINENRHWELEEILKGSELPEYFRNKEYVNIKVVGRGESKLGFCQIDCEVYGYQPILRIKILSSFAVVGSFLQLHVQDNEIVEIHLTSKERYLNIE